MSELDTYLFAAKAGTAKDFKKQHEHFFLVHVRDTEVEESDWSFQTQTFTNHRLGLSRLLEDEGLRLVDDYQRYVAYAVKKSSSSPWQERISVGRARNNDVVIADNSVSKLHAHFTLSAEGPLTLMDTGSRNGTKLNGGTIEQRVPIDCRDGDVLVFGTVEAQLMKSESFYRFLTEKLIHKAI